MLSLSQKYAIRSITSLLTQGNTRKVMKALIENEGSMTITDIWKLCKFSDRQITSQKVGLLKRLGLVRVEKRGSFRHVSVIDENWSKVKDWIESGEELYNDIKQS